MVVLGMAPKLLTDARETSYVILSSLLTAECSTVELPGKAQHICFHSNTTVEFVLRVFGDTPNALPFDLPGIIPILC
jgi:hypothetical protein